MRKMGWGFSLATAGMVFMASPVLAQSGSSGAEGTSSGGSTMGESSGASAGSATANALQGKVEKLDRTKNTMTLSGSDKILRIDASTMVMKNGVKATIDDVKEGDEVRASYLGSGTTVKVKSLEVGEPSGGAGK